MGFRPADGPCLTHSACGTIMEPPAGRVIHTREQLMSARKLSRLVGFLFVLAVMLGVVGTASAAVVEHTTGSAAEAGAGVGATLRMLDTVWT